MKYNGQIQSCSTGLRNLMIGFLLGVCLTLTVAATSDSDDSQGPYLCCPAGEDPVSVFVVDTKTGHTWRLSRADFYDFGTPQAPKSLRRNVTPLVD
jgi:hypothetical protein